MTTEEKIIQHTLTLVALSGYETFSMRQLAKAIGIVPSVLYHYFPDKDSLLKKVFDQTNTALGERRNLLPLRSNVTEMLRQRIQFQFDNAEAIVFVLKYYLAYRDTFRKLPTGYVPEKAYLHIEEVLRFGVMKGEFLDEQLAEQAKVITHAINGFVLEYYPAQMSDEEKNNLVNSITLFIYRGIVKPGDK